MKNKLSINTYLYFFIIILIILLFIPIKKIDNRKFIKKSFQLNSDIEKLYKIELQSKGKGIELIKEGDLWFVKSFDNLTDYLPVDSNRINKLLFELTKVRKMYKIVDKNVDKSSYLLNDTDTFYINSYFLDSTMQELSFGMLDFSQSSIYFLINDEDLIYETDYDFDFILKEKESFWYDPYLVSRELSGKNKIEDFQILEGLSVDKLEKFLELRHGGFYFDLSFSESDLLKKIVLMTGDETFISLNFYRTNNEQEIAVVSNYKNNILNKNYITKTKISYWTYSQLK